MILKDLEITSCEPLKIVHDNGDVLISTSDDFTLNRPTIFIQGILVKPQFGESMNLNDEIIYTQVSKYHSMLIKTNEDQLELILDKEHKDTLAPIGIHYGLHSYAGHPHTKPYFFDAPFRELLEDWNYLKYDLRFKTWINHKRKNEVHLTPLASFKWNLMIEVEKDNEGVWREKIGICSTEEEVYDSIDRDLEKFYPVADLPHLATEVEKWMTENNQEK